MREPPVRQESLPKESIEEEDNADLLAVLRAVYRRKWIVLAATMLTAALFYLFASSLPEQFTARATIMLDPREQQIIANQDQVVGDLKLNNPILESEVAILRSSSLLETVIEQIGIERFDALDPMNREPSLLDKVLGRTQTPPSPDATNTAEGAGALEPLISPERRRVNRIVGALREGLQIARLGESYVIEITLTSIDAELSAAVANTLAQNYIAAQLADRQRVAETATAWLSRQVEERRTEVQRAETTAEEYRRTQLSEAGASSTVIEQQLAELNRQLANVRSDIATEQARLEQLQNALADRGAIQVAETLDSSAIVSLRGKRQDLLREDVMLSSTLGPNHPSRLNILTELKQIDGSLQVEVDNVAQSFQNEIEVLAKREESLASEVDELETRLADIDTSSLRLRQLEREAEVARTTFEDLLARLGETRAQVEIQRAEAKLINLAQIPLGPSAPRAKLMAAFGATLGLSLSLIMVLVFELVTTGFVQPRRLERETGIRVISTLPKIKLAGPNEALHELEDRPYSLFAERIRQIRTVLTAGGTGRPQSVLVISSVPQEGKTTTSLALAHLCARSGLSTILIDLDTRRSVIQKELSPYVKLDLSDYMIGAAELDQAIIRPRGVDFDLAVTSRHPALLADSVSSGRMGELIDRLKTRYHIVIIDAPPILAVSDGLALSTVVDKVLYLVRWRKTSRRSVSSGLAALENLGAKPVGIVMTITDTDQDDASDHYGYGYGVDRNKAS